MVEEQPGAEPFRPQLVALAAGVYARREGKILILERSGGEVSGGWYLPGGAREPDEDIEDTARRELYEETGLVPDGPLTLIGLIPMHVYGTDTIHVSYACDCTTGDVVLSHEHSAARWIDPRDYRDGYLGDDALAALADQSERVAAIVRNVRADLDRYIAWADREMEIHRLRESQA